MTTVGTVGAIAVAVIVFVSDDCGGDVASRMARVGVPGEELDRCPVRP